MGCDGSGHNLPVHAVSFLFPKNCPTRFYVIQNEVLTCMPLPPSLPPSPSLPFPPLPSDTAIARMKARGPPALDPVEQEQEAMSAGLLQDLSVNDPPSDAAREDDVEEEEQYVKVCGREGGREGGGVAGGGLYLCGGMGEGGREGGEDS